MEGWRGPWASRLEDLEDRMHMVIGAKWWLTLLLLMAVVVALDPIEQTTISYDASTPTKVEYGANITTKEILNSIYTTHAYHYYHVKFPTIPNRNIAKTDITATIGESKVYEIALQPVSQIEDLDNVRTLYLGAVTTTAKTGDYILRLKTAPDAIGAFNITVGSFTIDPDISACGTLTASTYYTLTANITKTTAGACFTVNSNVSFNGQGFTVTMDSGSSGEAFSIAPTASQWVNISNVNIVVNAASTNALDENTLTTALSANITNVNMTLTASGACYRSVDASSLVLNFTNVRCQSASSAINGLLLSSGTKVLNFRNSYINTTNSGVTTISTSSAAPTQINFFNTTIAGTGTLALDFSDSYTTGSVFNQSTIVGNSQFNPATDGATLLFYNSTSNGQMTITDGGSASDPLPNITLSRFYTTGAIALTTNGLQAGGSLDKNYYQNISQLDITDTNSDGYGDAGTDYPYTTTTSDGYYTGTSALSDSNPCMYSSCTANPNSPTTPTNLAPTTNQEYVCSVNVSWTASTDGNSPTLTYYIYNKTTLIGSTTDTWLNWDISTLPNGSTQNLSVYASDGQNSSSNATTPNFNITHFNITARNFTGEQNAYYNYAYTASVNISACLQPSLYLSLSGSNVSAMLSGSGTQYNLTATPTTPKPTTFTKTAYNASWWFSHNGTTYPVLTSSINVTPYGLTQCGGLTNTTSVNITTRDSASSALVFTIYSSTSTNGGYTIGNISGTGNWSAWCILPTNESFSTTLSEGYYASGYDAQSLQRTITASNITQNFTVYLTNGSLTQQTQLRVVTGASIPVSGALIQIETFNAPSNYSLITTCTTDSTGSCVKELIANTQNYRFNISKGGITQSYGPEVISCLDTATACYRTFLFQYTDYIPCVFAGEYVGSCGYNTTSRELTCIGSGPSSCVATITLEANRLGNSTKVCSTTSAGPSATLSCTLPSVNGTYNYMFFAQNENDTIIMSYGQIDALQSNTPTTYGRSGWIAALVLFILISMLGFYNPAVSMALGVLSVGICVTLGLIPIEQGTVVVLLGVTAGAIAYKLKV